MSKEDLWCCPVCSRYWEHNSEQGASIDVLGACLACRASELTDADMIAIFKQKEKIELAEKIRANHIETDPIPAPVTMQLNVYRDQCLNNFEALSDLVLGEHGRQLEKWGVQERTAFEWMSYLAEEFGELAQAVNDHEYNPGAIDKYKDHVAEEAVQVATLALKIAEMFLEAKESTQEINGWVKGGK